MEEIIPFIEQSWTDTAVSEGLTVTTILVEDSRSESLFKAALVASKIVVTAFNVEIALALVALRTRFYVDTPFVFYIHGLASVACWPLKQWGVLDVWGKQDIFISSAQRDLDLLKLSVNTNNAFIVPFALLDNISRDDSQESELRQGHLSLYYVGRISEQKNLHTLLWALSHYRFKNFSPRISLDIFGGEDNLGSPNMGRESGHYLNVLISLVEQLGLSSVVKFHGHVDRTLIASRITPGKKIFISPSLHSDENFGMAALRALSMGHLAVLSNWGGHADFVQTFPESAYLVNVHVSETGPFIDLLSLVHVIENAATSLKKPGVSKGEAHYSFINIRNILREVLLSNADENFMIDKRVDILARRWSGYRLNKQSCRIFESYLDRIYHQFCMTYAGESNYFQMQPSVKQELLEIAPWVEIVDDSVKINDPHRGSNEVHFRNITDRDDWLLLNGYAYCREAFSKESLSERT
jgi:glycosyltransferase involved in cell wall biosynthesis